MILILVLCFMTSGEIDTEFKHNTFSNRMKTRTEHLRIIEKVISQQSDPDCSCELLDTSLSGVGDSDCSCSECLEANLAAFNELKEMEEETERQNNNRMTRRASSRVATKQQTNQVNRNNSNFNDKTRVKITDYKSVDKMRETRPKHSHNVNVISTSNLRQEVEEPEDPTFSRQCINDYIKITQYRARQYLNQRKQLQKNEIEERKKLKDMIKENLQALKFTVRAKRQEELVPREGGFEPDYKWNHQPYYCKTKKECRKAMTYQPDLQNKKEQLEQIKQRIKNYKMKTKKQQYECPDQCPNHHMRTSKKRLAEIQRFIEKKAKKYEENKKKQKEEKEKEKKVREAKLRAIDIRCKDIVAKSRKYDPDIQRTSFHNSIDHFSTFSDMRLFNLEKLKEKQNKRKVQKQIKQGGFLQEQMYENLSDNLIGDHPPIHSKLEAQSRYGERQNQESRQFCEKIVKEARIAECKKEPVAKPKPKKDSKKEMLAKEEKRKKEIQQEIEKKKEEIVKEYQKRNAAVGQKAGDSRNRR